MQKLGKKQLTIHLREALVELPLSLSQFPLELTEQGNSLIYTYDAHSEDTGIALVVRRLNEENIDFKDLHTSESSLEEIFVNLVKKVE